MLVMANGPGFVTIFAGPMFSGKSGSLITQANSAVRANKSVLAVKPSIDTRDKAQITTRLHNPVDDSNTKRSFGNAHSVSESEPDELEDLFEDMSPDVFIADEVQFFHKWFADFIWKLQSEQLAEVYIAGLDLNAWGKPFGHIPTLLAIADRVEKKQADCFVSDCDKKATRTQLTDPTIAESDSPIVVGGKDTYQARCRKCWKHPRKLSPQHHTKNSSPTS